MNKDYILIDLPNLDIFNEENGLVDFYKAIGFDFKGECSLNPSKVIMNTEDANRAVNIGSEKFGIDFSMLWLNNGPSSDNDTIVPKGKIKLEDGWNQA